MKKSTMRFLSLISCVLVLSMLLGALVSCNVVENNEETTSEETTSIEETTTAGNSDVASIDYTVEVMSAGGRAMQGVKFDVYANGELVGYGEIGENGKCKVSLPAGGIYEINLTNVPEGYDVKDSYSFVGTSAKIVLTSAVIDDEDLAGVTYGIGSVISTGYDRSYLASMVVEGLPMVRSNTVSHCSMEADGAEIENMEGAALFAMAQAEEVRCGEIRAISNYVGEERGEWDIPLALDRLTETIINLDLEDFE